MRNAVIVTRISKYPCLSNGTNAVIYMNEASTLINCTQSSVCTHSRGSLLYSTQDTTWYQITPIFKVCSHVGCNALHDPMQDTMCWKFQTLTQNHECRLTLSFKHMIIHNNNRKRHYKKVPLDEYIKTHPGAHPGLPKSFPRLLSTQPHLISNRFSPQFCSIVN